MVENFPVDYMHAILLRIMRKLLKTWMNVVPYKFSANQKDILDNSIDKIKKYFPCEFNRKPRLLREMDRFKATEFCTLLLYTGVILFNGILKEDRFNHFLILMVIVRTLCDGSKIRDGETLEYIQELCKIFVKQYKKLYTAKLSVVYKLHLLIHVVDDVKKYGMLDSFSAFPYEDMLGQIKKKIRSSHLPLAQLCRRISEGFLQSDKVGVLKNKENEFIVNSCRIIPHSFKNSCVKLTDSTVGIVKSFESNGKIRFMKFV